MIEKMEFISITGPKADIDRVVDQGIFTTQTICYPEVTKHYYHRRM